MSAYSLIISRVVQPRRVRRAGLEQPSDAERFLSLLISY